MRPLVIMAGLFFIIGFVTWLNGPLITFVQVAFGLGPVGAFLVPMCFYLSYLFCAAPAMGLARRIGLRNGIAMALGGMAAGTLVFGECVGRRWYPGALGGLSILGAGLTLLQVTVNPYVALLGTAGQAARRIAIMGIANKVSGIIAPVLFSILVMRDIGGVADRLHDAGSAQARETVLAVFAHAVVVPYRCMAVVLLVVAFGLRHVGLPDIRLRDAAAASLPRREGPAPRMGALAWAGIVVVFVYVGVEVLAGDGVGLYGSHVGLSLGQTRFLTSVTLGAMLCGYLLGTVLVPAMCSQLAYLALSAVLGMVLCLGVAFLHGVWSVACVTLLGLANAMMMPILFPLVLHLAGHRQSQATMLLVMAFCGGGVMPQVFALLIGIVGLKPAFAGLVMGSYGVVLLYALLLLRRVRGGTSGSDLGVLS
ncbi:glucose/galactose MFS transporter [Komagataeibacter saccharivorans]|uniref:glucose/galactose MFS transporter n=1 Tax=Komagataeibacter saccharivorans TaxID=265959 RepID=UPI0039ED5770